MVNFDFHKLLFPIEFENFCRDVLEIREKGKKFTTYKRGKDGGIDVRSTNTSEKIIAQCKLYNPNNYSGLINNLKKEVTKCKRLKPDRYIVCINIELTPSRASQIIEHFNGHILNEEDIIDGIKLNKYLGQKEYEHLFKTYSKLLVPNLATIEFALDNIVNRKFINKTKVFLNDIYSKNKLFHHTKQLPSIIQKLEDNKIIILSGNPGVGKTTTTMMITNYFINRKVNDVMFLEEEDFSETMGVAEENRLIIFDDFWGQNFSPSIQNRSTFQREFQTIIKHFINSNNSYLILTSRSYVIKDILENPEYETEDFIKNNNYVINLEEYSSEDKTRIFLNHSLYYDMDLDYLKVAQYSDHFEYIINHRNYSPRHIDFFIKTYLKQEYQSPYDFYKLLSNYIEKPSAFWNEAFQKLNPTSKLIVFILLVSSDPMSIEDLKTSFDSQQIEVKNVLNEDIIPLDFYKELKKLQEFYISSDKNEYYNTVLIKFQSPGIKDYLLEFLRGEGNLWIKPIISKAIFFNQLSFIFSTGNEEIYDYESDTHLYGKKIELNKELSNILKNKLISEFESLNFSNHEEKEFTDDLTRYNSNKDIKYYKLYTLNILFPSDQQGNGDIKNFILNEVLVDIDKFDFNSGKIVSARSMIYFPGIIKILHQNSSIIPEDIISIYHKSITYSMEYNYFYEFNEIFPVHFQKFLSPRIKKIKTHIKELIYDDIDHYLFEDEGSIGLELERLTNYGIEELSKNYKFRITKKIIQDLEKTFEISFSHLLKDPDKIHKKSKPKNEYSKENDKSKSHVSIIEEYLPNEEHETYNPSFFIKENKYHTLKKELKNKNSLLNNLKNDREIFEVICPFIFKNGIVLENLDTYQLLDLYLNEHCDKIGIRSKDFIAACNKIKQELDQTNSYSINQSKLNSILNTSQGSLTIDNLHPFIIQYKNWYRFSNSDVETFISTKYIEPLDQDEYNEAITDLLCEPDETKLLEFLQSANQAKLCDFYIIPEIKRLLNEIDNSSQQKILISFVDFFKIEFDLEWNQKDKMFEMSSSSYSEFYYEHIISFCNKKFYLHDFETYFCEYYHDKDVIERLYIDRCAAKELYTKVIKSVPKNTVRNRFNIDNTIGTFEIKLSDFLKSEDSYIIAKNIGMTKYVNNIIYKLNEIIKE